MASPRASIRVMGERRVRPNVPCLHSLVSRYPSALVSPSNHEPKAMSGTATAEAVVCVSKIVSLSM